MNTSRLSLHGPGAYLLRTPRPPPPPESTVYCSQGQSLSWRTRFKIARKNTRFYVHFFYETLVYSPVLGMTHFVFSSDAPKIAVEFHSSLVAKIFSVYEPTIVNPGRNFGEKRS
jgi:hypothetical protein